VLRAAQGEHLVHFRGAGKVFIKVGSATGSDNLALGTQQVRRLAQSGRSTKCRRQLSAKS
jgi:hypothetical protein